MSVFNCTKKTNELHTETKLDLCVCALYLKVYIRNFANEYSAIKKGQGSTVNKSQKGE